MPGAIFSNAQIIQSVSICSACSASAKRCRYGTDAADLTVKSRHRRSYQTIIATFSMAGDSPAGILTLDAPQADSLGQPDLEIMKTLASLLGVGLALGAHTNMPRLQVPAQSNRELP